jgi:fermentation-respiration switch protein FrsA (DUF1100 family)
LPIIKLHSGRDKLNAKLEVRKKSDAFLVCHGFGGSMHEPEENAVMHDLVQSGYTAMLVSHETGKKPNLIFQEQLRQLIDAITYLFEQVSVGRVHIFGISMGASNAVSVGAVDDRVSSIVASSGIMDCKLWLQQRLGNDFETLVSKSSRYEALQLKKREEYIGPLFDTRELLRISADEDTKKVKGRVIQVSVRTIRSLLTYRPILGIAGIRNKPIFFFHGTSDELVPYQHTLEMYKSARTRKYKLLIPEGDHGMILQDAVRNKILTMYLHKLRKLNLLD